MAMCQEGRGRGLQTRQLEARRASQDTCDTKNGSVHNSLGLGLWRLAQVVRMFKVVELWSPCC